jgi:DNA gyrase subunit A
MGVSFVKFKGDDRVVTIARNAEIPTDDEALDDTVEKDQPTEPDEGQDQ